MSIDGSIEGIEKYLPVYDSVETLGERIRPLQKGNKLIIVTDDNLADIYSDKVIAVLEGAGFDIDKCIIPSGEEGKTLKVYGGLLDSFAGAGLDRTDGVVALGGGVVGDAAGFAASTYMRGINVYQVPTTLLAMVDSSIGGKTGINLSEGKNMAGAFHLPKLVLTDISFLKTLPEGEFLNGLAEVIKTGVLAGNEILNKVNENDIEEMVRLCGRYKAYIVSGDEKDTGNRALLNLGHTIGHGIEKLSDYQIKHGYAVAKGLAKIIEISAGENWVADEKDRQELLTVIELLKKHGFNPEVGYSPKEVIDTIYMDKKRKNDEIDLIVPRGVGKCDIMPVKLTELKSLFEKYI